MDTKLDTKTLQKRDNFMVESRYSHIKWNPWVFIPLDHIGLDTLCMVLSFLTTRELLQCGNTCKSLQEAVSDDYIWEAVYKAYWQDQWESIFKKDTYRNQVLTRCKTRNNWLMGKHKKIMSTKIEDYLSRSHCLSKGILFLGTIVGKIYIYDTTTKRVIKQIEAHSRPINSLDSSGPLLVTGSADCTARVWMWNNLNKKLVLVKELPQDSKVQIVKINESYLITVGHDNIVRVYNHMWERIAAFSGETNYNVCSICLYDNTLLIGCDTDGMVVKWDLNKVEYNKCIYSDIIPINIFYCCNKIIIIGKKMIKILNSNIDKIEKTVKVPELEIYSATTNDDYIVMSNKKNVILYPIKNNEMNQFVILPHKGEGVVADAKRLVVIDQYEKWDSKLRVFDFENTQIHKNCCVIT